jgi:hypothetical protein
MLLRCFHIPPSLPRRDAIPAGQRAQSRGRRESLEQAERSIHALGVLGDPRATPI